MYHYIEKKWPSMKKTALQGAPRRDIRSPWRQLLSLPIPCHVHWQRSYCQSPAHPPAICGKPCFLGPSGCMRGAGAFGPLLRAGCAGAAWVRGESLGSGMRAGRLCLAPRVGGFVGQAPFQQRGHACSLRWRARGGLDDSVSSRSAGSDMRLHLDWCGVRWLFRGFCAGRHLGRTSAAACGADTVQKGP